VQIASPGRGRGLFPKAGRRWPRPESIGYDKSRARFFAATAPRLRGEKASRRGPWPSTRDHFAVLRFSQDFVITSLLETEIQSCKQRRDASRGLTNRSRNSRSRILAT